MYCELPSPRISVNNGLKKRRPRVNPNPWPNDFDIFLLYSMTGKAVLPKAERNLTTAEYISPRL